MKEYTDIYDSHAHYDSTAFDGDRARLLEEDLPLNRVRCVINMGTRIRSCAASIGLAGCNPYFFAGVGIHPSEIDEELPENWLDCLRQWLEEPKVVAIGEIGLDYYWKDNAPRERQMEVFAAQLQLAKETGYPVCVHDRESHADVLALLKEYRPQGVVHCFSGSAEMAREIADLGMYIGIGGAVTFKNARKILDVARQAKRLIPHPLYRRADWGAAGRKRPDGVGSLQRQHPQAVPPGRPALSREPKKRAAKSIRRS